MLDIEKVINSLRRSRAIFHSEADFQHSLAWEIHRVYPKSKIRLELPHTGNNGQRVHIDIKVDLEGVSYFIELKYKKAKIFFADKDNERFNLSQDAAHDLGRYDFIKDLMRLEEFTKQSPKSIGFAIMLTNDDLYWNRSNRSIYSSDFFLNNGRSVKKAIELKWHMDTGEGTLKGRKQPLRLRSRYSIVWKDYSELEKGKKSKFRYLLLTVT